MGFLSDLWNASVGDYKDLAEKWGDPLTFRGQLNMLSGGGIGVIELSARLPFTHTAVLMKHLTPDMRRDREAMLSSATAPRKIVYGRTRVGCNLVYGESGGDQNEHLHLITVFTGHEIDRYDEIWFNDQKAATVSGGVVTVLAPFVGLVTIELHDGTQTTASAAMVAESLANAIKTNPAATEGLWTTDHKLLGCAYAHIKLTYSESVYATGIPTIKAVLRGKRVYDPRSGLTAWSDNPPLCIRDYMLIPTPFGGGGFANDEINTDRFITAADICDEMTAAGEKRYTLNGPITLDGTPAAIVKSMLVCMAGQPNYSDGQWSVYAGASTPSVATIDESWLNGGISFTTGSNKNELINTAKGVFTNPADMWADSDFPAVPAGFGTPPDAAYWSVTATPLQYVPLQTYTVNQYAIVAGKVYRAITAVPINTPPPDGGKWTLVEEYSPGTAYTAGHVVQRAGVIYTATGAVPVANPYLAEDLEELTLDLSLPFVTSPTTAQRLATIEIQKSRRGMTLTYACNFKAAELEAMDTIKVNNTLLGWSEKTFRIMSWEFAAMGGVNLSLVEDDPLIWLEPSEYGTLTPPGATNLPTPWLVAAPSDLTLTPRTYDSNNGAASRVDLIVSWQPGAASASRYQVQYTPLDSGSADFGVWRDVGSIIDTSVTISALASATYSVRVRTLSGTGALSEWITDSIFVPNPDTMVPDVTGLELFGQGNDTEFVGKHIKLRWNKVSPRTNDVVIGDAAPNQYPGWFRHYELKLYAGSTLLRTEYLQAETYSYDFEKNYVDTTGAPARTVTAELRAVATWGDSSEIAASITVTNPAPPVPANITGTAFIGGLSVSFDQLTIPDVSGYEIHASQTAGFAPTGHISGEGTCINSGLESSYFQKQAAYGPWYVKVGAYDTFGTDGMTYSAEVTVAVAAPATVMLEELKDKLGYSQFAPGVYPIRIVNELPTLPDDLYPQGTSVTLTTDNQIYRSTGTAWTASIPAVGITGQLTNEQLAEIAAAKISGQLTNAQIAAIAAAKMTGQIVSTQITDGAISTPKIAAGAVTAATIAANTITAGQIAAGTITATQIAANTITAAKIVAGTITAAEIAANTITAAKIAAGTITATEIATGAITSAKILAGAITAGKLAAGAIIAGDAVIANAAIASAQIISLTADKITTGTMTASQSITVGGVIIDAGTSTNNGSIHLGKTSATDTTNSGFWMGNVAGTAKLLIGNATNYLNWDATALTIRGDILATSVSAAAVNASGFTAQTANISNAAITSVKISDAAITTAKIGTAQVDTLQIAGNAVTIPVSATDAATYNLSTDITTHLYAAITLDTPANVLVVINAKHDQISDDDNFSFAVFRDGVQIYSEECRAATNFPTAHILNTGLSAGSYSFDLRFWGPGGLGAYISHQTITLLAVLR